MFKRIVILGALLLLPLTSFAEEKKRDEPQSFCQQSVSTVGAAKVVAPFVLFMAYHLTPRNVDLPLIGQRTNFKTEAATVIMMAAEGYFVAQEYPSKTFQVMGTLIAPVVAFGFGTVAGLNPKLGNPISLRTGRLMLGAAELAVAAYWYWQYSKCESSQSAQGDEGGL